MNNGNDDDFGATELMDRYMTAAITGLSVSMGQRKAKDMAEQARQIAFESIKQRGKLMADMRTFADQAVSQAMIPQQPVGQYDNPNFSRGPQRAGAGGSITGPNCLLCGGKKSEASLTGHLQCAYSHYAPHGKATDPSTVGAGA